MPWRWSVCFRQIIGYLRILASGASKTREQAQSEADLSYFEHSGTWMKQKKMQMDADELEVWLKFIEHRESACARMEAKEGDNADEADGAGEPGEDAT
jgi:hypothetical protein